MLACCHSVQNYRSCFRSFTTPLFKACYTGKLCIEHDIYGVQPLTVDTIQHSFFLGSSNNYIYHLFSESKYVRCYGKSWRNWADVQISFFCLFVCLFVCFFCIYWKLLKLSFLCSLFRVLMIGLVILCIYVYRYLKNKSIRNK